MRVEGLQGTGGEIDIHLTGHIQILIEYKFDFRIGNAVALQQAGAGMELQTAAATNGSFHIHGAPVGGSLGDFRVRENSQIPGVDQLGEGHPLQLQSLPGNHVEIAQADPFKIGRLVNPDKRGQRRIQLPGKFLPAGIVCAGQGDKFAGEVDFPLTVGAGELVVDDRGRILQREAAGSSHNFWRRNLLTALVLGEHLPDSLLKIHRKLFRNRENLRETKLADDLHHRGFSIPAMGLGCIHSHPSFFLFSYYSGVKRKRQGQQITFPMR